MPKSSLHPAASPSNAPEAVDRWVHEARRLTEPARVHWCTGSDAEAAQLTAELLRSGEFERLNEERFPGCFRPSHARAPEQEAPVLWHCVA